jgi:putative ubiquitin-RnfH superfamily antitoxin RatB of RatAB toxin-antitoxin module
VIYALPDEAAAGHPAACRGQHGAQAIEASGLLQKHPEIDLAKNKIGIFGKLTKPDAVLRDQDRVEIYRPLIADPKEVRKQRAAAGKVMKKGAGDERGRIRAARLAGAYSGNSPSTPAQLACTSFGDLLRCAARHRGSSARPCCRASPRVRRTPGPAASACALAVFLFCAPRAVPCRPSRRFLRLLLTLAKLHLAVGQRLAGGRLARRRRCLDLALLPVTLPVGGRSEITVGCFHPAIDRSGLAQQCASAGVTAARAKRFMVIQR